MAEWIDVGAESACPKGEKMIVHTDAGKIAVFHLNSGFYAIEDVCSHDGGELASGDCEGDEIICPRHGARFCIKNGKSLTPPAYEDIETFAVRNVQGMIQVEIEC
ncbi:MAG: non-heme iron oxygenase ferredoxin subunit [Mariprofundaceae bacterium]|nr:non-heme iron oxygenase ferredoxin subunit [Mariprofundaceae bacterium]